MLDRLSLTVALQQLDDITDDGDDLCDTSGECDIQYAASIYKLAPILRKNLPELAEGMRIGQLKTRCVNCCDLQSCKFTHNCTGQK